MNTCATAKYRAFGRGDRLLAEMPLATGLGDSFSARRLLMGRWLPPSLHGSATHARCMRRGSLRDFWLLLDTSACTPLMAPPVVPPPRVLVALQLLAKVRAMLPSLEADESLRRRMTLLQTPPPRVRVAMQPLSLRQAQAGRPQSPSLPLSEMLPELVAHAGEREGVHTSSVSTCLCTGWMRIRVNEWVCHRPLPTQ